VSAYGKGFDIATASADYSVELDASSIMGRVVHSAHVEGQLRSGSVLSRASVVSDAGTFEMEVGIRGILHEQRYSVLVDGSDINLAKLTGSDTLESVLSVQATLDGHHWSANTAEAEADIRLGPSLLMGDTISGAVLTARYGNGTMKVDSCVIDAGTLRLKGHGELTLPDIVEATVEVVFPDLSRIDRFVQGDSLRGSVLVQAEASGRLDSLRGSVTLQGGRVSIGESTADSVYGTAALMTDHGVMAGRGSAVARGLETAGFTADTLSIEADAAGDTVRLDMHLGMPGEISLGGRAEVRQGDSLLISLDGCALEIGATAWRQEGPPSRIVLHEDGAGCSGITIATGTQRVSLAGRVSYGDSLAVDLQIDSLLLADVLRLYPIPVDITGRLSVVLRISGMFRNPQAQALVSVDDLWIAGRRAGDATVSAGLSDSVLTYNASVEGLLENTLLSEGSIPVHVSFRHASGWFDKHRDANVALRADRFDLSRIPSSVLPVDSVSGVLSGQLGMSGSLSAPSLNGSLRLSEGGLSWQRFGVQYRDIALVLSGEGDRLRVDSLVARAGKGTLRCEGVLFDGADLVHGEPGLATLRLTASDFALMQGKSINAVTDMDLTAGISGDSITYSGDVLISSSHIWLPVVMSKLSKQKEADLPLLLQAGGHMESASADTVPRVSVPEQNPLEINGSVHLSIPRNSWVQSPDLNMLYEGELDIRHVRGKPRIAGYIKVYRGTYFFLGKKFSVESGRLDFREEAGLDPALQFEVLYRFRDAFREMSELRMDISGSASSPILRFTKNDEPVSESDAVSYVLFGHSASELSQGERNVVGNSTLDMAGNMLASRVTNQLGAALGFDVVELQGEDNWSRGTFTAGKYLTDDLFVSYTKGFGEGDDNDINTETITLEYELTPFLILRLTEGTSRHSGIDLIFRFD
jgi:autotransporter translocation and assembly factor TamB